MAHISNFSHQTPMSVHWHGIVVSLVVRLVRLICVTEQAEARTVNVIIELVAVRTVMKERLASFSLHYRSLNVKSAGTTIAWGFFRRSKHSTLVDSPSTPEVSLLYFEVILWASCFVVLELASLIDGAFNCNCFNSVGSSPSPAKLEMRIDRFCLKFVSSIWFVGRWEKKFLAFRTFSTNWFSLFIKWYMDEDVGIVHVMRIAASIEMSHWLVSPSMMHCFWTLFCDLKVFPNGSRRKAALDWGVSSQIVPVQRSHRCLKTFRRTSHERLSNESRRDQFPISDVCIPGRYSAKVQHHTSASGMSKERYRIDQIEVCHDRKIHSAVQQNYLIWEK